jgi:hypothetical protein
VSEFLIGCDLSTLYRSGSGSITGTIHVELDGFAFPEKGWSDFVVVILGWWLKSLDRIGRGDEAAELLFMDGPFAIQLSTVGGASCSLELWEKSSSETLFASGTVPILDLIGEIERVAAEVMKECSGRGWQSADLDSLQDLLSGKSANSRRVM